MNCAFSRALRLCLATDFKNVFNHIDIKISSQHLLILACVNQLEHPRLGLVIAKKNIRKAIGRNRVKRHIREIFRLNQDKFGSLDIIVLVRKGLADLTSYDINQLLSKQLLKLVR